MEEILRVPMVGAFERLPDEIGRLFGEAQQRQRAPTITVLELGQGCGELAKPVSELGIGQSVLANAARQAAGNRLCEGEGGAANASACAHGSEA